MSSLFSTARLRGAFRCFIAVALVSSFSVDPTDAQDVQAKIRMRAPKTDTFTDIQPVFTSFPAIATVLQDPAPVPVPAVAPPSPVIAQPEPASGRVALASARLTSTRATAQKIATKFVKFRQDEIAPAINGATESDEDRGEQIGVISQENSQLPGLKGPVKIFYDARTNSVTLIGDDEDCEIVEAAINQMREANEDAQGIPASVPLRFSRSEDIVDSIRQIYNDNFARSTGEATIEALQTPNALLVFGSKDAIKAVQDIVNEIEKSAPAETEGDFISVNLKNISATAAKARLDEFFEGQPDAGLPADAVAVVADYRSNTILVRGDPSLVKKAKLLIDAIDIDEETKSTSSVRVFQLQNALAGELSVILQDAINGALRNVPQPLQANTGGGITSQATNSQPADQVTSEIRSSKLELQTIGRNGEVVSSGVLFDVRVTPDTSSNSLIVRAPASAMPLVEELIRQLDRLPNAETVIKVFQIFNGDAEQLLNMLEQIFGVGQAANQNVGANPGNLNQLPLQSAAATPGSTLVNLRFAIDQRTNSIIATGPSGEMQVVEDLLNRLDEDRRTRRKTIVYRLSNANVLDVQEALDNLLETRSDRNSTDPRVFGSVFADQEIVVVPEVGSNSLIVSSLPENFPEIENIIRRLDRRPPMVKVKVLIAEVDLGAIEEFGVELGVQDSLLFDRGLAGGDVPGPIGPADIGFNFNNANAANQANVRPGQVGAQALSNLALGRVNTALGYGGLVLSAGNDSVSVLLRALKDKNALRVLSKPHIMTLENLQGRVSVGQSVPRITDSTQTINGGISNGVEDRDVGVIMEITPRVSPDGMIVMFVNVVKSALGAEETGPAVAVDNNGNVVRQAPINATSAQTTIMSRSGQTIVFSGLIQETKTHIERGAPILSDLPVIGPLFKFESDEARRSELLIFMTPTLIDTEQAIDAQNNDEMNRMHWCLCDVAEVYGNTGYDAHQADMESLQTVYPDQNSIEVRDLNTDQIEMPAFESSQLRSDPSVRRVSAESQARTSGVDGAASRIGTIKPRKSLLQGIADRIRGTDRPNRNTRNRMDFESLKQSHRTR